MAKYAHASPIITWRATRYPHVTPPADAVLSSILLKRTLNIVDYYLAAASKSNVRRTELDEGHVDGPPTEIWVLILVEAGNRAKRCEGPVVSSTRRTADALRSTAQARADDGVLCAHRHLSGTDAFGRRLGVGRPGVCGSPMTPAGVLQSTTAKRKHYVRPDRICGI